MTEEEARSVAIADVPRETSDRMDQFVSALREEAGRQNLVSASTLNQIWYRHILDSAQLLRLAPQIGVWVDIGSGAGLPGLVVGILRQQLTVLIEPRAKRAQFLQAVVEQLDLQNRITISAKSAASAPAISASVISARAVASLDALFGMALRFASSETVWVLPKGRSAADELAAAQASWQGDFRLAPSQTDSSASIVIARGVRPR